MVFLQAFTQQRSSLIYLAKSSLLDDCQHAFGPRACGCQAAAGDGVGTEFSCYGNQLTWGFECDDSVLTERVRIAHFFGLSLDVHMEVLFLRAGKVLRHVLNIHG